MLLAGKCSGHIRHSSDVMNTDYEIIIIYELRTTAKSKTIMYIHYEKGVIVGRVANCEEILLLLLILVILFYRLVNHQNN